MIIPRETVQPLFYWASVLHLDVQTFNTFLKCFIYSPDSEAIYSAFTFILLDGLVIVSLLIVKLSEIKAKKKKRRSTLKS